MFLTYLYIFADSLISSIVRPPCKVSLLNCCTFSSCLCQSMHARPVVGSIVAYHRSRLQHKQGATADRWLSLLTETLTVGQSYSQLKPAVYMVTSAVTKLFLMKMYVRLAMNLPTADNMCFLPLKRF